MTEETEKTYRKLPCRGPAGAFWLQDGASSLWLAEDHLLSVDRHQFQENYKRFYLKDIQWIVTRKTTTGKTINWVAAILAGLLALAATLVQSSGPRYTCIGFGVVWLLILILNTIRGPTCVCHLGTAVQTLQLFALRRLPAVRKTMAILVPAIQNAQASEEIPEEAYSAASPPSEVPLPSATKPQPAQQAAILTAYTKTSPKTNYKGHWHARLHKTMVANAFAALLPFAINSFPVILFQLAALTAAAGLAVTALVIQTRERIWNRLAMVTWAVAAFFLVGCFLLEGISAGLGASAPDILHDQWGMFLVLAEHSPLDSYLRLTLVLYHAVGAGTLGGIGLFLTRRFQHEQMKRATPPPLPSGGSAPRPDASPERATEPPPQDTENVD